MPPSPSDDKQLIKQIEAFNAANYSADEIELKIATAFRDLGRFEDKINAEELSVIMRNLVHYMFARQKFAGRDVRVVHNVPRMEVNIRDGQAEVKYIVHIHKPIVAFIEFQYVLINDPVSADKRLRVRKGSLSIKEKTRRYDLKARAVLAAANIKGIARKELADLTGVIIKTLPPQLKRHGLEGKLTGAEFTLNDQLLNVSLWGEFKSLSVE
jgi:hypothetical protein